MSLQIKNLKCNTEEFQKSCLFDFSFAHEIVLEKNLKSTYQTSIFLYFALFSQCIVLINAKAFKLSGIMLNNLV